MTDPKVIAVHVLWRVAWTAPDKALPHEQTYGRFAEGEAKVQRLVAQRADNIRWQREEVKALAVPARSSKGEGDA